MTIAFFSDIHGNLPITCCCTSTRKPSWRTRKACAPSSCAWRTMSSKPPKPWRPLRCPTSMPACSVRLT